MVKNKIYWVTPLTVILAFFAGILLSLVHHLFYKHLHGSVAPTGEYHSIIGKVSKQQVNLAVGNPLAFLVQSTFALAVTVSYVQVFWRALKTARAGARLSDVDTAFSVLQDILGLFKASLWRVQSILFPMAVIFWLIRIPSILTPGTLSVQTTLVKPSPSTMTYVPPSLVNVTFQQYQNIYTYDVTTLWLAYGLDIFFAGLAVVIGCTSLWLSGVAYDANFSTILRMSRIDIRSMTAGHNEDIKRRNSNEDNGGKPLSQTLATTVIHMHPRHIKGSVKHGHCKLHCFQ